MSIIFSGTGSFRSMEALVTGREPYLLIGDETSIYDIEWTYTPNDTSTPTSQGYGKALTAARAGKNCLKITDSVGFSYGTCGGGLDDFELVIEDVECGVSKQSY